ncbi:hypothetical protein J6590_034626 [Homalodisca vitripennis]|nr:hypothetical protein J6590_034626 [Homalodisca vitripennis]
MHCWGIQQFNPACPVISISACAIYRTFLEPLTPARRRRCCDVAGRRDPHYGLGSAINYTDIERGVQRCSLSQSAYRTWGNLLNTGAHTALSPHQVTRILRFARPVSLGYESGVGSGRYNINCGRRMFDVKGLNLGSLLNSSQQELLSSASSLSQGLPASPGLLGSHRLDKSTRSVINCLLIPLLAGCLWRERQPHLPSESAPRRTSWEPPGNSSIPKGSPYTPRRPESHIYQTVLAVVGSVMT